MTMRKSTRNALIGTGAAVAAITAVGAAAYTISKSLLEYALDREAPGILQKGKGRLSGAGKEYDHLVAQVDAAAQNLENSGCVSVDIISRDGIKLVGHWYENPDAQRVVVAMHGWRSSWSQDFGMIADFLHNNGCSVLYAEQRGQNSSGGDHMTFGLLERYDCLDWINWVNTYTGQTLPVYLAGISMGATTVLMAAGLELPVNVRGIVADCGFTSPYAIWKHVTEENLHLSYKLHGNLVERLCQRKIRMGAKEYSTIVAMNGCQIPVLFVHGSDDRFVPVTMTYENYRACAAPKELLVVPGAGHGLSYYVEQDRYEEKVKAFWAEYDT